MMRPFRFLHRAPNNNLVDASSQIEESSNNEFSDTNSNHDIFDDSASFNSGEIILSPPRKLRFIRASPARIASPRESQQRRSTVARTSPQQRGTIAPRATPRRKLTLPSVIPQRQRTITPAPS